MIIEITATEVKEIVSYYLLINPKPIFSRVSDVGHFGVDKFAV